MKKTCNLLALLLFFSILYPSFSQASTILCGNCHSNPPLDSDNGGCKVVSFSHPKHTNGSDLAYCLRCHPSVGDNHPTVTHNDNFVSFSSIFSGNLAYNTTEKTCTNSYCHANQTSPVWGSGTTNCGSCHEAPPRNSQHLGHYSSTTLPTYISSKNESTQNEYRFGCGKCHFPSGASQIKHSSGKVKASQTAEVVFNLNTTPANPLGKYTTTDTLLNTDARGFTYSNGTCSNLYCHSDGKSSYTSVSVSWDSTITCASCHGGAADEASVTLSAPHDTHVGTNVNNLACIKCHNATVDATGNIAYKFNHVNGTRDISFAKYSASFGTRTGFYTGTQCRNTYCHSDGNGGSKTITWDTAQATCSTCHDYKAPTEMATGKHKEHINNAVDADLGNFKCSECHDMTVNASDAIQYGLGRHVNGGKDVYFSGFNGHTGGYDAAARTCRNNYCHSSGQASSGTLGNISTPVFRTAADWTSVTNYVCNSCHGQDNGVSVYGQPNYINRSTTSRAWFNGHYVPGHVSAATDCVKCHSATVAGNGTDILNTGNHLNGSRNVSFALGGTYDSVNKRCSNTDSSGCHGSMVIRWGGKANCADCHTVAGTETDDFVYGSGSPKATINTTEFGTVGHGRAAAYPYTGNAGANLTCENCHDSAAAHDASGNPFRLVSSAAIQPSRPDTLCLSCHGTQGNHDLAHVGQGDWTWTPKCVDCHDPHGDAAGVTGGQYNAAMVQSKVSYAASDTYGAPASTEAVDFPANFERAQSLAAFNWSSFVVNTGQTNKGVCRVCHTTAASFSRTAYSSHNSDQGACVTCHNHDSGFKPAGCNSCHGYPPNAADNKHDNVGAVGAHDKHVTGQSVQCSMCHGHNGSGSNHNQSAVAGGYTSILPAANITMDLSGVPLFQNMTADYNGTPGSMTPNKTCSNVQCHYGTSRDWSCEP